MVSTKFRFSIWNVVPANTDPHACPGGGFIIDRIGQDNSFFQHILQHPSVSGQPLTIIDAYYSAAPERPFPAAIHDAIDVTSWVFANTSGEWDTSKVVLSGFSAGGNLALAMSASFGPDAANLIKGLIAFFPACDTSKPLPPARTYFPVDPKTKFPGFVLTDAQTRRRFDSYFYAQPELSIRKSPLASPSYADITAFPSKVLLFTCEYDSLREQGEALRKKLEGNVDVRGWIVPGVGHNWDHFVERPGQKGFQEKVQAYDASAELVAEILRGD
jgi:acetyl esterase/lipase